jgi:cell division protein FtsW (lipid II flippase)
MNNIESMGWMGILSVVFLIFCFYFTLTFIENIKKDDERVAKQSKLAAILCLAVALLIPAYYIF